MHIYVIYKFMNVFKQWLNNNLTTQSSIIASVLVSVSYYTKTNDKDFNYKLVLEQITLFSEKNRYNQFMV